MKTLFATLATVFAISGAGASGQDAADSAFATIFGDVRGSAPIVQIEAIPNAQGVLRVSGNCEVELPFLGSA